MNSSRLSSVDAYRGLVMLLMLAEVLRLCSVAAALPESEVWGLLCYHQTHAQWSGCHLHDLVQPSFTFLVGVSLPFSLAKRRARGDSFCDMFSHALVRSLVLVVMGIALISIDSSRLVLKFEDTLSQIGLGYWLLFLLAFKSPRFRWGVVAGILVGYWLMFALYPIAPTGFDPVRAGVTADWATTNALTGWGAHWQRNENFASAVDDWLMSAIPIYAPASSGLTTLNFVPTLVTMLLGLAAGETLKDARSPEAKIGWLVGAGAIGLTVGSFLDWTGLCPIVKSLWTPSWVLFSGGWGFLALAFFYYVVDVRRKQAVVFPLVVIGMNSIVAYAMSHLYPRFAFGALRRVIGADAFNVLGPAYAPVLYGAAVLVCYYLVLYTMYKFKWFLRI